MATHGSGNPTWVDYPSTTTMVSAAALENLEKPLDEGSPIRAHANSGMISAVVGTSETAIFTYSWTQSYSCTAVDVVAWLSGYCSANSTTFGAAGQVALRMRIQTSSGGSTLWDSGSGRWNGFHMIGYGGFKSRNEPTMSTCPSGLAFSGGSSYRIQITGLLDPNATGAVTYDQWYCRVAEAMGSTT